MISLVAISRSLAGLWDPGFLFGICFLFGLLTPFERVIAVGALELPLKPLLLTKTYWPLSQDPPYCLSLSLPREVCLSLVLSYEFGEIVICMTESVSYAGSSLIYCLLMSSLSIPESTVLFMMSCSLLPRVLCCLLSESGRFFSEFVLSVTLFNESNCKVCCLIWTVETGEWLSEPANAPLIDLSTYPDWIPGCLRGPGLLTCCLPKLKLPICRSL